MNRRAKPRALDPSKRTSRRRRPTAIISQLLVGLVMFGSLASPTAAQTPSKLTVNGVTVSGSSVTTAVTVADPSGKPIAGLADTSFAVEIDGQPVTSLELDTNVDSALPLGMVLTMDISNTMSAASITGAKDAFSGLVRALRSTDEATLVTISTQVTQVVKPTSDQAALIAGVNGVTPGGRTALYAAVVRSVEYAKASPQPRKVIVLVTEGGGRVGEEFGGASGDISRTMALNATATGGAAVFVVGIGKEADVTFLSALAQNSGGQYISATSGKDVAQLYTLISERLRLEYSLTAPLPTGLPAGLHKLTVTANGAMGESTFTTSVAVAAPPPPAFTGLAAELTQKSLVKVTNLPTGSDVRFALDGQAVSNTGTSDRRAIELDPYKLAPTVHALRAQYDAANPSKAIEASFRVVALPPKIVQPTILPGLRPGDFVRVELQAQAGSNPVVTYLVDGKAVETDTDKPYEFTLPPASEFAAGEHTFALSVDAGGQKVEQSFVFQGPKPPEAKSNTLAYGLLALFVIAALGAAAYGGRIAVARSKARRDALVVTDAPERLLEWANAHRGDRTLPQPVAPVAETPAGPWGTFEVIEGEGAGTTFPLKDDRELVGRGKFCSVRLTDKAIEEAHFVVTHGGELLASTPTCLVLIDGAEVRAGQLVDGSEVRLGGTVLRYRSGTPPAGT
ncbi:MAG: VWA domain-containing protein [Anaerolineaceae bacterium]